MMWSIIYFIMDWWPVVPIFIVWATISLLAIGGAIRSGDE